MASAAPVFSDTDSSWNLMDKIRQSGPVDVTAPYDTASLAGKTILITGGASGFGASFARHWASLGANIIIGDVDDAAGEQLVAELRTLPNSSGHHLYQHCDVSKWTDQVALFKAGAAFNPNGGGIDAVVANAGIVDNDATGSGRGIENPKDLDSDAPPPPKLAVLAVNLTGVIYTTHLALFWLPRNGGKSPLDDSNSNSNSGPRRRDRHLLLIGSFAGMSPLPTQVLYTTAKHGVTGLFRALRATTWRHGVRLNMLAPYFVSTPLISKTVVPMLVGAGGAGLATVEDVVDAGTRLMADESIAGRGLYIGPRFRVVGDGEDVRLATRSEEREAAAAAAASSSSSSSSGKVRTQAIWEFNAYDYEATELFSWRTTSMLRAVSDIRGWFGTLADVFSAVFGRRQ